MNVMSEGVREEVTISAIMQTLVENPEVSKNYIPGTCLSFGEILDNSNPATEDADMQILRDYVKNNPEARNYYVEDCSYFDGDGSGKSVLIRAGENVYVAFDGTELDEWVDDGQGLVGTTIQQQRAADRFDEYVERFGLTSNDNITVTGHSKGANKAMFVTMSAQHSDIIDNCVALDGEGFSNQTFREWEASYSKEEFNSRASRVTLVYGQHDYVHGQGRYLAYPENRYCLDYKEINAINGGLFGGMASMHAHQYLFDRTWDGKFTCKLNKECEPGPIPKYIDRFMEEYMQLSDEDIAASAPQLMTVIQLIFGLMEGKPNLLASDGSLFCPDLDQVLVVLAKTERGKKLIAILYELFVYCNPTLATVFSIYICSVLIRAGKSKKETNSSNSNVNSVREIYLNEELFVELQVLFEKIYSEALEAAEFAESAEVVEYDSKLCEVAKRSLIRKADDLKEIMRIIVESFSKTDAENAKSARAIGESYIGTEYYDIAEKIYK